MYRIKGWNKFQHFKDRRPPWIKLYRDILEDPDWHELDGDTAKILVSLWLIASEDIDGHLPDTRRLAFRLRLKETQLKQALTKLSHWLERADINSISNRYQADAPETETETEGETETETEISLPKGRESEAGLPPCPHQQVVDLFHEVLPELPKVIVWNKTRQGYLKARWKEVAVEKKWASQQDGIEYFRDFFEFVRKSKFLMGKTASNGKRPFECELEWLLRPNNWVKVIEGKYHGA